MNADVAERAADVLFRHMEHAPLRNAQATYQMQIGKVHIAQGAGLYDIGGGHIVLEETQGLGDEQVLAQLLSLSEYHFRVGVLNSHRLLAEHIAARS